MSYSLRPHGPYQASLSITNTRSLLKLMSVELVVPFNHLILYCPLLLPSLIIPSIRPFPMSQFCTSGGQSIGASASASFLPTEYSGLISFRIDWLDIIAVQETLKSLPQQFKSINSSVSAFFIVQLSHPYMTTGKTIALTRQTWP